MEMASGPDSRLSPDMRLAIALSVDRQALVTRQANWALASVQVAASHIYAQGQSGYHADALDDAHHDAPNPDDPDLDVDHRRRPGGQRQLPRHAEPHPGLRPHGGVRVLPGRDGHVAQRLRRAADPASWRWTRATPGRPARRRSCNRSWRARGSPSRSSRRPAGRPPASCCPTDAADLALIPRTTTPFLSESVAWYSNLLGSAGPERLAELDELRQQHVRQPGHQGLPAAEHGHRRQPTTRRPTCSCGTTCVALPLFTEPTALISSRKIANVTPTPTSNSLLWYAQYWAVRVPESTNNTTPSLPGP